MILGPNNLLLLQLSEKVSRIFEKQIFFIFHPTGFSKMYDFNDNLTFLGGNYWDFLTNVWWVWHLGPL